MPVSKSQLDVLSKYRVSQQASFGRQLFYCANAMLVVGLTLGKSFMPVSNANDVRIVPFVATKSLLTSAVRIPMPLYVVPVNALKQFMPSIMSMVLFVNEKEGTAALSVVGLIILLVSFVAVLTLMRTYHNQYLAQQSRIAIQRKQEGRVETSTETKSGLTPQMEDNLQQTALYYSLFWVNAVFLSVVNVLAVTVFSQLPSLYSYGCSVGAPVVLLALLSRRK